MPSPSASVVRDTGGWVFSNREQRFALSATPTSLVLSILASGADQAGGNLQNHPVALERVSITTAKNPQETVELRHGFLPAPQPSLP
ncbi:hypothetical protein [Holophaga foetida]|uniref:hypothetical protein n=1 Tax=Holophaga foetida TaxID=35839 RepID=UPI00024745DB|nr:hypothetical protein [Holophaga foetida]